MNEPTPAPASVAPASPTTAEQLRWFAEEVHPHDSSLKAYLRSSFPTVRDVDDVVQESYARIWKAAMARKVRSARGLLFKVARHLAIDALRHNRAAPFEPLRETALWSVIEERRRGADALAYDEKVYLMGEALAALPERCRMIFILRKLNQVPQKDIARQMGISERTVESQVTRGMKLCEAWLRKRGVHGFYRDER